MADNLDDEVFVLENGIATNQNVPLILQHDLEEEEGIVGFGLGDGFPDVAVAHNQIIQDDLGGNLPGMAEEEHPGFPGMQMISNGLHLSMSSTQSSVPSSSSVAFEHGEVLGTSTPALDVEAGCYVNECYQSSTSELSEFTPSVEIQPGTETVRFKDLTKKSPGVSEEKGSSEEKTDASTSSSENKATQTGVAGTGRIAEASTSTFDNSEIMRPNPPNSPIGFGTSLSRSGSATHLLRRYRNRVNTQVQLNNPDRPSNLFRKFGSYFLILVFVLLLAIIACLEGLLPQNYITALLIFSALSIIGSIGCFVKACWEERDLAPDRPSFRSGYGSTARTRPALSSTA